MDAFKSISEGIGQTSQPSTGSGASLQSTETMQESFSQPSTVSAGSQGGGPVARADNRVGYIPRNMDTNMLNQAQPQGGNGLAGQYTSNTGVPNGFGSFGNSQPQNIPNGLAASMFSKRDWFGGNQPTQAPGQYDVIAGAQLI